MVVRVQLRKVALLAFLLTAANILLQAQKGGGQNSASSQAASQTASAAPAASSSSSPSSASLSGISYSRDSWREISVLPPPKTFGIVNDDTVGTWLDDLQRHSFRKDVILLCYTLKQNPSAAQPFLLEPTWPAAETAPPKVNDHELCTNQVKSPYRAISLTMGRFIVVRVDLSELPPELRNRIETLNINVTNAAGTAINSSRGLSLNPSLIRPRMALLSGQTFPCNDDDHAFSPYTVAGIPLRAAFCPNQAYLPVLPNGRVDIREFRAHPQPAFSHDVNVVYLTWPVPLAADTLPTLSINLIYTPVAPALPWRPNTFYPAGSIVISTAAGQTNGHYYMALAGVTTPPTPGPDFDDGIVEVPRFADGGPGLTWRKVGPVCTTSNPAGGGGGAASPSPIPVDGLRVWTAGDSYNQGDLILPPTPNCHYYRAEVTPPANAEIAKNTKDGEPAFQTDGKTLTADGNLKLSWQDMGTLSVPTWAANTSYAAGAYITPSPGNGYYYQAIHPGVSGAFQPGFRLDDDGIVRESSGLIWLDVGAATTPPASIKVLKHWTPRTPYILGDGILDAATGHYYLAIEPGISGYHPPAFAVPEPQVVGDGTHLWQDIGTTPPASATLGSQPADQTVSLLNLTLPQVHSLAWFNIASGMVASSLRPTVLTTYPGTAIPAMLPTNTTAQNGTSSTAFATDCPQGISSCTFYSQAKGSRLVDPVVGLTVYALKPLDVEQPFRLWELVPGIDFNVSLLNPTNNFHVGFASEFFVRNLQLVYGISLVDDTRINPNTSPVNVTTYTTTGNGTGATTTSTTTTLNLGTATNPIYLYPSTYKKFNKGGYVGFTLNITGLINAVAGVIP